MNSIDTDLQKQPKWYKEEFIPKLFFMKEVVTQIKPDEAVLNDSNLISMIHLSH
jgi:hypothetical protein